MDSSQSSFDRRRSCSESDNNCLNSTSKSPESDIPSSLGLISKVDLNRFNSYPIISSVPISTSVNNDDLYVESPMGQGMGTKLSARKADTEKQEQTLKAVSVLVKNIDNWVTENIEYDGLPDEDMILEQFLRKELCLHFMKIQLE